MKSGFRLIHTSNFNASPQATQYLALGMGLAVALQDRGFALVETKSTVEGVISTYEFTLDGVERQPPAVLLRQALEAVQNNIRLRDEQAAHPHGMFVILELHLGTDDPIEAVILKAGHMDLLKMFSANGFVPMNADGTNKELIAMKLGLDLDNKIAYTPAIHKRIAEQLMNGATTKEVESLNEEIEEVSKRVHKADPRQPGVPKYPQMIFQNAKIGFVLGANTFRLGSKWFDTLKPGDIVQAIDGVGTHLGWLKVKTVVRDTLASALRRDALSNHGVKEMEIDSLEEGIEYLLHILVGVYPDTRLDNDTEVSVITFEPQLVGVEPKAFA